MKRTLLVVSAVLLAGALAIPAFAQSTGGASSSSGTSVTAPSGTSADVGAGMKTEQKETSSNPAINPPAATKPTTPPEVMAPSAQEMATQVARDISKAQENLKEAEKHQKEGEKALKSGDEASAKQQFKMAQDMLGMNATVSSSSEIGAPSSMPPSLSTKTIEHGPASNPGAPLNPSSSTK